MISHNIIRFGKIKFLTNNNKNNFMTLYYIEYSMSMIMIVRHLGHELTLIKLIF